MKHGTAFELGQFAHILTPFTVALASACEGRDPKKVIASLENRGEALTKRIVGVLDEFEGLTSDSPAETPTSHAQPPVVMVVSTYKIEDETIEAVRVVSSRDDFTVEDALKAADNGAPIRTDEQWQQILRSRSAIPHELNSYWLVTDRPGPGGPRYVSTLYRSGGGWCNGWLSLGNRWNRSELVLRRRVS